MLLLLGILFLTLTALVILGTIGMFSVRNKNIQNAISVAMVFLSLCIGAVSFTALPSNYIFQKIISILLALMAILGLYLFLAKKINLLSGKILIISSNIFGLLFLIFFK